MGEPDASRTWRKGIKERLHSGIISESSESQFKERGYDGRHDIRDALSLASHHRLSEP